MIEYKMENIDNTISLEKAAARKCVSKRSITQQVSVGGWDIRKITRGRYVLNEQEKSVKREVTDDKLNRIIVEQEAIEFNDEDRPLNDQEIHWLLNDARYEVGSILPDDLKAMGNSLKKTYEALKNFGDLNKLELEDSAWSFMAVETIVEVFKGRKARNDKRLWLWKW